MGPIAESELLNILKGEGLTLCATHEGSDDILNNTGKVIEHLQKLGCKHTAYASVSRRGRFLEAGARR